MVIVYKINGYIIGGNVIMQGIYLLGGIEYVLVLVLCCVVIEIFNMYYVIFQWNDFFLQVMVVLKLCIVDLILEVLVFCWDILMGLLGMGMNQFVILIWVCGMIEEMVDVQFVLMIILDFLCLSNCVDMMIIFNVFGGLWCGVEIMVIFFNSFLNILVNVFFLMVFIVDVLFLLKGFVIFLMVIDNILVIMIFWGDGSFFVSGVQWFLIDFCYMWVWFQMLEVWMFIMGMNVIGVLEFCGNGLLMFILCGFGVFGNRMGIFIVIIVGGNNGVQV